MDTQTVSFFVFPVLFSEPYRFWVPVMVRVIKPETGCQQDNRHDEEDRFHAPPGSQNPSQEGPRHGTELLCRKQQAVNTSLEIRRRMLSHDGIEGRIDAGKTEADGKLGKGKRCQCAGESLQSFPDTGDKNRYSENADESLFLSRFPP